MNGPVVREDLAAFIEIERVAVAPDGLIAAVAAVPDPNSNTYRRDVMVGPADGPLELTDAGAPGRTYLPTWFAIDDRLAVVTHDPGGWSIRVSAAAASSPWRTIAADLPDPVEELALAPDGQTVLFVVREPDDREWYATPEDRRPPLRLTHLRYREDGVGWTANTRRQAYVVSVDGGEPSRLSDGGYDDSQFSWHPDGAAVYFVSERHADREFSVANDIWRMPIGNDGTARPAERLTTTGAMYASPQPSCDGQWLAFGSVDVVGFPASQHLAAMNLASGDTVVLSEKLDRDVHADTAVWTTDSEIAALVSRSGRIDLVAFDVRTNDFRELVRGGGYRVTAFDVASDTLGLVRSAPAEPPLLLSGTASDLTSVYEPNAELVASREMVEPEYIPVRVDTDITVDAWLLRPPQAAAESPPPMVVWLQGGGTQYGYQWSHEVQMLCSSGYAVLYLNARGSAGYGTDWMRAVNGRGAAVPGSGWGGVDVADVASVVEHVLGEDPDLDRSRVGVMGGSYGGLMVTQLLAQTDLFRAGWAERGPYNLISDAGTKDEAPWFFTAYLGKSHVEDLQSYWDASPLKRVEDITAPLIIVHSENDYRCTIGQAEELFMALKLLGREVEFVRFPGEGHNLTRGGSPVHRMQRAEILLEWFGRHLRPATGGDH